MLLTATRMLERALLSGDTSRALKIVAELREMGADKHALAALVG
jgi:DNA polymerase III delta subunit